MLTVWPKVRERIGQQRMSLAAYLADARPLSVTEQGVQIGLPDFSLHQEVLSRAENLRFVAQVLQEVMGCPLSVAYTTLPSPIPGASSEDQTHPSVEETPETPAPPIVGHIIELFNATILPSPRPQS
ncbi:MAG: hypothetical protein HYZ89_00120 [Candidatus Omnitrophica bacterium]|nr:hypothetical protein [Candidatus Omnitrophota bacterium]